MLRCSQVPEHNESWYVRISHTPLASKVKQVLPAVNSVKLHLALNDNKQEHYLQIHTWLYSSSACWPLPPDFCSKATRKS